MRGSKSPPAAYNSRPTIVSFNGSSGARSVWSTMNSRKRRIRSAFVKTPLAMTLHTALRICSGDGCCIGFRYCTAILPFRGACEGGTISSVTNFQKIRIPPNPPVLKYLHAISIFAQPRSRSSPFYTSLESASCIHHAGRSFYEDKIRISPNSQRPARRPKVRAGKNRPPPPKKDDYFPRADSIIYRRDPIAPKRLFLPLKNPASSPPSASPSRPS